MNIKRFLTTACSVAFAAMTFTSCVQKDDWDTPPINCENRFAAPTMSMADFVALTPASGYKEFTEDVIFDGYVVSSDEDGNFYKTLSFQDSPENPTVGLQIELDKTGNYADFPVGTHIRINAKGLRLALDRGVVKIGSVDDTYTIGRIPSILVPNYLSGVCNGNGQMDIQKIVPKKLSSLNEAKQIQYINTLVKVENAQFQTGEIFPDQKKYIDFITGTNTGKDTDRYLEDNAGGSTALRTSGFASFGTQLLPKGSGDITFVVSKYNNNWQMLLRNTDDVNFTGDRVDTTPPKGGSSIAYLGSFTEDFESYSNNLEEFPKYVNDPVLGNRYWRLRSFSGNKYIQLSAYNAAGATETFFAIPVDFTAASSMSFKTKFGFFNGQPIKVYTSTDYVPGGDITSATLTDITSNFTYPNGPASGYGTTFDASGVYNFDASLTGNGFVIFKYEGDGNSGVTTTAQIDDIVVN